MDKRPTPSPAIGGSSNMHLMNEGWKHNPAATKGGITADGIVKSGPDITLKI